MVDETRQPLEIGLLEKVFSEVRIRASEYGMTPEEFAGYLIDIGLGVVPSLEQAGETEILVLKLLAGSRDALEMGGGSAEEVAVMLVESQLKKARPPKSLIRGMEKVMGSQSSPATNREVLESISQKLRYWRSANRK